MMDEIQKVLRDGKTDVIDVVSTAFEQAKNVIGIFYFTLILIMIIIIYLFNS